MFKLLLQRPISIIAKRSNFSTVRAPVAKGKINFMFKT